MICVRFPNGQLVQYNDANLLSWEDKYCTLSVKDGYKVAFVPYTSGAIIEFVQPCAVSNPLQPLTNKENLEAFVANIEKCEHTALLAQLKAKLSRFSRKTYGWK